MSETNESKNTGADKRKYPRILIRIKCKGETAKFYSRDISCDGIFLNKCMELDQGSVLSMEFRIPDNRKNIQVKGILVWKDKEGAGIRFLTLSTSDFEIIRDDINKHM